MFFNQVAQDVKSSTNVEIGEQSILLKRSGRKDIEIKLLETGQIRRTSDGEGNVLFLENVQAFKCLKNNLAMSCTLSSKGGEQFKRSIFIHYAIKVTTFE
ncbi:hypothetical protein JCM9157_3459 [Halalkalibacter akibai JCM 9157]|uniref:Uncharacterized protein n=2 Tax=Halalkalibacter akibai TaxID=1411 RepID=W4QXC6_HALA3|nr:hypothetical protein JCM9157_3459 [Halalkalibacter akibai JCM 9157]